MTRRAPEPQWSDGDALVLMRAASLAAILAPQSKPFRNAFERWHRAMTAGTAPRQGAARIELRRAALNVCQAAERETAGASA